MSRGIDRTELVREQLAKGGATKNTREEGKGGKEIPIDSTARDEARKAMKEKAEKLREETLKYQKELNQYGNNGDARSSGETFNFSDE